MKFYNARVKDATLALPSGIVANLIHILELISEFGPSLGRLHIFVKKTRRIPKNDRDVARKRMKEVLDDG